MFKFKVDMMDTSVTVKKALDFGQYILDNEALKDSNYYVPTDQHYLEKSGILHSKLGKGVLIWQTPYARRLYYNPRYNFSTDENPNARGLWFENAKAQGLKQWLDTSEKAVKSKL